MSDLANTDTIVLEYDLYNLPTSQHKAGLVGLLLMIDSMDMRRISPVPKVEYDATTARIFVTQKSLQAVYNDLFNASWIEASSKTKWKEKEPKRIEEKETESIDGKKRTEKRFIYDVVQPKGEFLQTLYSGNDIWVKLWRDMLWSTLRGIPKTRIVYEERATGKPSSEARKTLDNMRKAQEAAQKHETHTEGIASSLYVGAQDINAEKVPFLGQVQLNFLLNFWTIPSLTYVPSLINVDGGMENSGYVLAVPEPATLKVFIQDIKNLLGSLSSEVSGFRPRGARIDLPEEGGLEYLYQFAHTRVAQTDIADSLIAIELYHVERRGNSTRTLTATRILPDANVLEDYDALRNDCYNPLFKAQRIKNLLSGNTWYQGMDALFNQYPIGFFIQSGDSPRIPFFGNDARRKFQALEKQFQYNKGGSFMTGDTGDDHLVLCINRLIREYANRKTEEKSGIKFDEFRNKKDDKGRIKYPQEYREAREKVCSDAFLAMRGRRDQDYIEYFTGTICSVPQYLPEQDYLVVSQGLLTGWDKVKTLSMLALSAASRVGGIGEEQEKGGD